LVWVLLTWPVPPALPELAGRLPAFLQPLADKVAHAGLFLVQALLLHRGLRRGRDAGGALLLAVALSLSYAAATELRQRSVAGRDADAADLAANAVGTLAYAAWSLASSRRRQPAAE
jgi:VanZ family protein